MKRIQLNSQTAFYGLIAALVIVLLGVGVMLNWANKQLRVQAESIAEKRVEAESLERQTAQARLYKQELEELGKLTGVVDAVLPDSKSQENIIGELIDIAAKRGLQLENISFGGSADAQNPETSQTEKVDGLPGVFSLVIQTQIETDYENVLQFLEDLENNKRQFEVTSLSLSPREDDINFIATLSITTYIKP